MPSKRKREDGVAAGTTARSARASTRSKAKTTQADSSTAASGSVASKDSDIEMDPPPKRTRNATTKTTRGGTAKNKGQAEYEPDDDPVHNGDHLAPDDPKEANNSGKANVAKKSSEAKPEPYSVQRALQLFDEYVDPDDRDVIGPEGFERLCNDAGIAMDGVAPLLLAWQLGTSEMAKVKRQEWEKGIKELRISSVDVLAFALRELEDLILLEKPAVKPPPANHKKAAAEPYNRTRYYQYARDPKKAYNELYVFCFILAKPEVSRSLDMETGCAIWSVLVAPKYPTMKDILEFISEKGTYRGVNKDLWTMTLEFCQTVSPNLAGYDADGAWPTMLDEFVSWKRQKIDGIPS